MFVLSARLSAMLLGVFLSASVFADDPSQPNQNMRESTLPISVRGVITSSDPSKSVALLQDEDRGSLVAVKKGFWLYQRAQVIAIISPRTVILETSGELEFLGQRPLAYDREVH